jgi:hypothetical protein
MVLMLTGALGGAIWDGAKGALWLVTAGQVITMLAWWAAFAVRIRTTEAVVKPDTEVEPFGLGALLHDAARSLAATSTSAPITSGPLPAPLASVTNSSADLVASANGSAAPTGSARSRWLPAAPRTD